MWSSNFGTRNCGSAVVDSNRMLPSNSPVMIEGYCKKCYSCTKILDIKTERKASKLSRMNNLYFIVRIQCSRSQFEILKIKLYHSDPEVLLKLNCPTALTKECNVRN